MNTFVVNTTACLYKNKSGQNLNNSYPTGSIKNSPPTYTLTHEPIRLSNSKAGSKAGHLCLTGLDRQSLGYQVCSDLWLPDPVSKGQLYQLLY